jgi:acetyl-CoA synthetase
VNLPQKVETIVTHLAVWKLGAVSVPLSTLFGPSALRYRLDDCDVQALVIDDTNVETIREVRSDLQSLDTVMTVDVEDQRDDEIPFWDALFSISKSFNPVETDAEDDAIIVYTSGTTGDPKGAALAQESIFGHLPSFLTVLSNMRIDDDAMYWTAAEWAWVIIMHGVMSSLFYGKPVLAHARGKFDPERAFELLERHEITNYLVPPTALRMMMQVEDPGERYDLSSVRVITSGGEALGENLVAKAQDVFGEEVAVHETYGQTEANAMVGDCTALTEFQEETIGPVAPGHELRVVDPDTLEVLDPGEIGEIAVEYGNNPVCFQRYWNDEERTERKVRDGWLLTEDLGWMDEDGYVAYEGRKDHVIICSGYRIGPEEIEDTLATHEAVVEVGVIGVPHETRGEVPKAFVVLNDDHGGSEELAADLQDYVQGELAKYEYPREIEFIQSLPKTVTGKIQRTDLEQMEEASE